MNSPWIIDQSHNYKNLFKKINKIFSLYVSDKGFVSKIFKECIHLYKKTNNPQFKTQAKDLNKDFSKENMQIPLSTRQIETYLVFKH